MAALDSGGQNQERMTTERKHLSLGIGEYYEYLRCKYPKMPTPKLRNQAHNLFLEQYPIVPVKPYAEFFRDLKAKHPKMQYKQLRDRAYRLFLMQMRTKRKHPSQKPCGRREKGDGLATRHSVWMTFHRNGRRK